MNSMNMPPPPPPAPPQFAVGPWQQQQLPFNVPTHMVANPPPPWNMNMAASNYNNNVNTNSNIMQKQTHEQRTNEMKLVMMGNQKALVTPADIAAPNAALAPLPEHWTEHKAPSGITFYHNEKSKTSQYERPTPAAAAAQSNAIPSQHQPTQQSQASVAAAGSSSSSSKKEKSGSGKKWKVYVEAKSGKKYYSDGATSMWERPADFVDDAAAVLNDNGGNASSKDDSQTPLEYATKEEAIEAFKSLLRDKGVVSSTKWPECVKFCSNDVRWGACSTKSERRQIFAEYQNKCANEEREQKRMQTKKARDDYNKLLSETSGIDLHSRFNDHRAKLSADDRFSAVEKEHLREEYFYDHIDDLQKREERQRRVAQQNIYNGFVEFLKEKNITSSSTW